MGNLDQKLEVAIKHFWHTRGRQAKSQGTRTGLRDTGLRAAVTGGKHLDGFVVLCRDLLIAAGVPEATVFWNSSLELPGYYRAEKCWDLLAVAKGHLLNGSTVTIQTTASIQTFEWFEQASSPER